jgi:hypothetical protein
MKRIYPFIMVSIFLIAGAFLRYSFLAYTWKIPLYDQREYLIMANDVLNGSWAINCCSRMYVYPFFLAGIMKIFGINNLEAIRYAQIVLEVFTGLILSAAAYRIWKKHTIALIILGLYMFNPLTSGYVGYILTETLTFFFIACVAYVSVLLAENKTQTAVWTLWGFLIGAFVYTRIVFFWWGIFSIVITPIMLYRISKTSITRILCAGIGFFVITSYVLVGNYVIYNKITPVHPYNITTTGMYFGTINRRWPDLLIDVQKEIPFYIYEIANSLYRSMDSKETYIAFNKEMEKKLIQTIQQDPRHYIRDRFQSMWMRWDKTHLFYYTDPFYPLDTPWVRFGNAVFLTFAFLGVVHLLLFHFSKIKPSLLIILIIESGLILYLTIPLSLLAPEERITIPAYPLLFIFVAYYLSELNVSLKKLKLFKKPHQIS